MQPDSLLQPTKFFQKLVSQRKRFLTRLSSAHLCIVAAAENDRAGSLEATESVKGVLKSFCKKVKVVFGLESLLQYIASDRPDLIINLEYGSLGDSGVVTALAEGLQIPITGNSFLPIALMWNKESTKRVLSSFGILTPRFLSIKCSDHRKALSYIKQKKLRWPIIIKPLESSVSNGITVLKSSRKLVEALHLASNISVKAIAEEYIFGRELSVGVFGSDTNVTVLPIVEIFIRGGGPQSHDVKFIKGKKQNLIPAPIPKKIAAQCKRIALECHHALGADCISRMDCIYSKGKFYVLEVNGNPGFLTGSLFPKEAKAVGVDYETLILSWVYLSLKRANHWLSK